MVSARLLRGMLAALAEAGWVKETAALDTTYVNAHRFAHAGIGGSGTGIGPSRGGQTTKVHVLADVLGRPAVVQLTPGNASDVRIAPEVIADALGLPQRVVDNTLRLRFSVLQFHLGGHAAGGESSMRVLVAVACLALGGCISGVAVRPLSPVISAEDAVAYADAKARIMAALAADAGFATGSVSWYEVAKSGFNYIDDRCAIYFDELFRLNRNRETFSSAANAFQQTTSAILIATGASVISQGVVAQAFGLSRSLVELSANSFLYQLPPATTYGFVRETQRAYREGAASNASQVRSASDAYHLVQQYLRTCLPVSIEAQLVDHVAAARAVGSATPGAGVRIDVGTRNDAAVILETPVRRLEQPTIRPSTDGAINNLEGRTRPDDVRRYQAVLCVPQTGRWDLTTRQALAALLTGANEPQADIATAGLSARSRRLLNRAVREVKDCRSAGFADAAAVGATLRVR